MAGLDTLPDAQMVALIAQAAGVQPRGARIMGRGVTAIGWRIDTDAEPVAVRIALPEDVRSEPTRVEAEFAILDALHPLDGRVPRPIATSSDEDILDPLRGALAWSVQTLVEGTPLDKSPAPLDAARDLGALLARLHALPVEGWGLLEDRRGPLYGVAPDAASGLVSRWPNLWPYDGSTLLAHPIVRLRPALLEPLSRLREQLLRYAEMDARAVCHSDLHADNILCDADGRLAGTIDFGDAFVGYPAWDLANFAYHFGWPATEALIEGYESKTVMREVRLAEARQLAVPSALVKVRKYLDRDPARLERTLAFLEETLPHAIRREA